MTFSRAKGTGWTDNVDNITATEINTIDINQSNAVDGAAGGTYTPSADLSIASLKSPSLKETTVIEKLTLGVLARFILTPTDVTVLGALVAIRDIDAGSGGVFFRVDYSAATTGDIEVAAATTAKVTDGEVIILLFNNPHASTNIDVNSEGGGVNPIYTTTAGTGVEPEWCALIFNTSINGSNPDGEWELLMHGQSS